MSKCRILLLPQLILDLLYLFRLGGKPQRIFPLGSRLLHLSLFLVKIAEVVVNCSRALLIDDRLLQIFLRFRKLALPVKQPPEGIEERTVRRLDVHRAANQGFGVPQSLVAISEKVPEVVQNGGIVGVYLERLSQ